MWGLAFVIFGNSSISHR